MSMSERPRPIIIIGAGMVGLRAAQILHQHGKPFFLFEADHLPGGRIQTLYQQRFRMDRGFQVLQTSYPEVQKAFSLKNLNPHRFAPGALIWDGGRFLRVCDPFRQPWHLLETLLAPIGSLRDKILIGLLRNRVLRAGEDGVWRFPTIPTIDFLKQFGFSDRIIRLFFRPFLAGVFLDKTLQAPANQFAFVYRHFSLGLVAVPAQGMGALAQEMVSGLPTGRFRFGVRVSRIIPQSEGVLVELETGESVLGQSVILASLPGNLLNFQKQDKEKDAGPGQELTFGSVTTHWFASPRRVATGPYLVLNGTETGPVNHAAVLSEVAPSYAPPEQSLIALNCIGVSAGDGDLDFNPGLAKSQVREWWGPSVDQWRHLHTDRIPLALPRTQNMPEGPPRHRGLDPRIHLAGDQTTHPSLEGALISGKRAALQAISQHKGV